MKNVWERLADSAEKLNRVTDEMNQTVSTIEQWLSGLNLGIQTEIEVPQVGWLGYCRWSSGGMWRLYIKSPHGDKWSFNDAPRTMRIESVSFIPQLLLALNDESEKLRLQIQEANEKAERVWRILNEHISDR